MGQWSMQNIVGAKRALRDMLLMPREIDGMRGDVSAVRDLIGEIISKLDDRAAEPAAGENPPIEEAYLRWREFYAARQLHYSEILKELGDHGDSYSEWYKSGGYGYDPRQSRTWLIKETSLADFRGRCLDIGSGDGFWSWLLSEWYYVVGIDPVAGGVELANAIKRRLPLTIQRRVDFVVGDALDVQDKYDVVFCRAPSFFNYPIYQEFDPAMLDLDRLRLREIYMKNDPATADAKIAAYPSPSSPTARHNYADKWREYLGKMMAMTTKLFVFILSTNKDYFGVYVGDTFNHDPKDVARLFAEFGTSRVTMDSTNTYVVGEIYK